MIGGQPLQRLDVRSLQAFLALLHFEFDALVFDQGLEAVAFDVTEVSEEVSAAFVLCNEAVALAVVEPLHGAGFCRHGRIPNCLSKNNAQHMPSHAATLKIIVWGGLAVSAAGRLGQCRGEQIENKHGLAYNCASNVHEVVPDVALFIQQASKRCGDNATLCPMNSRFTGTIEPYDDHQFLSSR